MMAVATNGALAFGDSSSGIVGAHSFAGDEHSWNNTTSTAMCHVQGESKTDMKRVLDKRIE